jgi:hypothetical protein
MTRPMTVSSLKVFQAHLSKKMKGFFNFFLADFVELEKLFGNIVLNEI